ncbi:DUF6622 family protein [Comamonas composti]|uniref:DUF6622 family protein n=1 Tax=Comamonas composti TaxID=408558 RepID=UPI000403A011
MQWTPAIAVHLAAALAATAVGPVALWARRRGAARPHLHRAAGHAWVTLMLATALSAIFIPARLGPSWQGLGLVHFLVLLTLAMLFMSFRSLLRGNIDGHRKTMQRLYFGACVGAGLFTLAPDRRLGQWLIGQFQQFSQSSLLFKLLLNQPGMLLKATPAWVWALLLALIALGASQLRAREAGLLRILLMPSAMGLLSIWSLLSAFGPAGQSAGLLLAWLLLTLLTGALILTLLPQAPAGTHYDTTSHKFVLPGSPLPLLLILGIFMTKYLLGLELALHPGLAGDIQLGFSMAVLYGLFSGWFMARTARLLRLKPGPRQLAMT